MQTKLSNDSSSVSTPFPPHLTVPQFIAWLELRLSEGDSATRIGRELGVTHAAIRRWIGGQSGVSATVLLLAGRIMQEPREMASGLGVG